jgi:hypothetical protein
MMNIYKLPLILEPQPEGGYTITCPLLSNLITEADTFAEILPHVATHPKIRPIPGALQSHLRQA